MKLLVTGAAGFIGYALAQSLCQRGNDVVGIDNLNDYYSVELKQARLQQLESHENFRFVRMDMSESAVLEELFKQYRFDRVLNMAAQAGVRYSLENPRAYIESNVVGTFNVMEAARELKVKHLLMASTSSVYGANTDMPFAETDKADTPLTIYAATKKANEAMGHSYAHLWDLPTTMFRFFTVYGPWGRPDLALFKFVDAILDDRPIDIYNHGDMYRDFTHVNDLVHGIRLLIDAVPVRPEPGTEIPEWDSLSPAAPFRVVNIGNSDKVRLMDFVEAIEDALGMKAKRNFMDMQMGDVPATWANADLLKNLTGYKPQTDIRDGVAEFVTWFRDYYNK